MPIVQTLTRSLLDRDALALISRQLWTVHQRLALHSDGNLPSAVELAVALRLHLQERDAQRAAHAARSPANLAPPPLPSDAPPLSLLRFLLDVADATYLLCDDDPSTLRTALQSLSLPPVPLAHRRHAAKMAPGFFVSHDRRRDALIVAVRGSRDVGDLITNLSTDRRPFLCGAAHAGIAAAARNLQDALRPLLARRIVALRPRNGVVAVGHSLGGAAAAALVMLLRDGPAPAGEHPAATASLRLARCYAFAPPPFASRALARRAALMPIFTIVYGLDVVPRLSAASVDRLLRTLARYDWSGRIGSRIGAAVSDVMREVGFGGAAGNNEVGGGPSQSLSSLLSGGGGTDEGNNASNGNTSRELVVVDGRTRRRSSPGSSLDHGVVANVSGTIANVADGALRARVVAPDTTMGAALNVALFVTRALGRGVQGNARRMAAAAADDGGDGRGQRGTEGQEQEQFGGGSTSNAASRGGGGGGGGGGVGGDSRRRSRSGSGSSGSGNDSGTNAPEEVLLVGEIWHLVGRFRGIEERERALQVREVALVRRAARFFKDVEVSAWMTIDHYPKPMREAIDLLQRRETRGGVGAVSAVGGGGGPLVRARTGSGAVVSASLPPQLTYEYRRQSHA